MATVTLSNTETTRVWGLWLGAYESTTHHARIEAFSGLNLAVPVPAVNLFAPGTCINPGVAGMLTTGMNSDAPTLALDFDSTGRVDLVVTLPATDGRAILKDPAWYFNYGLQYVVPDTAPTPGGTCEVDPAFVCVSTGEDEFETEITATVSAAQVIACSDVATDVAVSGPGDLAAVTRHTSSIWIEWQESISYRRFPSDPTSELFTETRLVSQELVYFIDFPTLYLVDLATITVSESARADFVLIHQEVNVVDVDVDESSTASDTVDLEVILHVAFYLPGRSPLID